MTTSTLPAPAPAGAAVVPIDRGVLATAEVVARVTRIQEVMRALMKEGTHYGTIPGTQKPTLYKPGAELLLMTFRIATEPRVEDLSTADEVRYRATVRATYQQTGEILGEMVGECSSSEEKYRWRRPVCDEEFDETPADLRREKWAKGQSKPYKQKQIRTSPADVANTVLKMAVKRGLIAVALSVLSASDIFAQDLEDLSPELRDAVGAEGRGKAEKSEPQRRSTTRSTSARNGGRPKEQQPAPADAVGLVERAWQPDGKTYYAVKLRDDERIFTFWTKDGEPLYRDLKGFEGTEHRARLTYREVVKDGRTYYNLVGVAIADAAASPAAEASTDRVPGEEG